MELGLFSQEVEIDAAFDLVRAGGASEAVRQLQAPLAVEIDVRRAFPHDDEVRDVDRRLLQHGGEIEAAIRALKARLVDQSWRQHGDEVLDRGEVFGDVVARGAGGRRRAAAAAEEVIGVGVQEIDARRCRVHRTACVHFDHRRVVVIQQELIGRLGTQVELPPHRVEGVDVVEHDAGEAIGHLSSLPLPIGEQKDPVWREWHAERHAELMLVQAIGARRVQDRPRVHAVVNTEVIERSGGPVGSRSGDDVDEAAERASVLGEIRGVEDAEFLRRFLRRRRARQAGERLHVVGAVDLHHGVQLGLTRKREPRRRRGSDADVRLLERAAADVLAPRGDAARQLHEVDEVPAADRQRLDLRRRDDAADVHLVRLDQRRLAFHGHDFGERAEVHLEIDLRRAADGQDNAGSSSGFEVLELGAEVVGARIERCDPIAPGGIGRRRARRSGRCALQRERHAWQRSAGFIANGTVECCCGDLRGGCVSDAANDD